MLVDAFPIHSTDSQMLMPFVFLQDMGFSLFD